jgi:hypothetical protein
MLGLANTLAMVNLNMDSARYSKETKNNIAVAIQEHHTACMSVTPRNPAPMSQWSMEEIFAWFRRSPLIHYCVATVLGAIGLWLAKTAPAPVAPTAATAPTAAVAQTAAVAMPSTATAEVLRQFAGQLAMEFAKELRSNDVGRVRGNL